MKTNNKNWNKTSSLKRMGIMMLASAAAGALLGFISMFILNGRNGVIVSGMDVFLTQIQRTMLPILLIITIISVILGELNISRLKANCKKVLETEDEECDKWEYEEEKTGAWGVVINILSQILCVLVLSTGYSVRYIADGHNQNMTASCLIFLGCFAYNGFWQARYVKAIQTAHPEKQGDPSSGNFQQQWLNSCDEAEKEIIYQSAYKTYIQTTRWIPLLLVITMLGHLFFNTGIMAVAVVAVIWLVVTISYLRSCVESKRTKLRE